MRKQRIGLEHHIDWPLEWGNTRHIDAIDKNTAFAQRLEARQHAQQCGFAATRSAQQAENFAFIDIQADLADGGKGSKIFADILDTHIRHRRVITPGLGGWWCGFGLRHCVNFVKWRHPSPRQLQLPGGRAVMSSREDVICRF